MLATARYLTLPHLKKDRVCQVALWERGRGASGKEGVQSRHRHLGRAPRHAFRVKRDVWCTTIVPMSLPGLKTSSSIWRKAFRFMCVPEQPSSMYSRKID